MKNNRPNIKPRVKVRTGWPGSQTQPYYWFGPLANNGNYACVKTLFVDIKNMLH